MTRKYRCNFSRFITETYDVAQLMIFQRLSVPRVLRLRMQRKEMMYQRYRFAEDIVNRYERIR